MTEPAIDIYIGGGEEQRLASDVLKFSISRRTKARCRFHDMWKFSRSYHLPKDPAARPRTPFSFQRFLIPELCGYQQNALYLDSDMQVFQDIQLLWDIDLKDASCSGVKDKLGTKHFSVMKLNCAKCDWKIDEIISRLDSGSLSYEGLMFDLDLGQETVFTIPWHWNSIELFGADISLLHYSYMNLQPWISAENPLAPIWMSELFEALDDGFINLYNVEKDIELGFIRPGLAYQAQHRVADPKLLPREVLATDKSFVAPHMQSHGPWWSARRGFKK